MFLRLTNHLIPHSMLNVDVVEVKTALTANTLPVLIARLFIRNVFKTMNFLVYLR